MSRVAEEQNRRLLRARDAMDRAYVDHFYGTDLGLRDPSGNAIRILQQGEATLRREARREAAASA